MELFKEVADVGVDVTFFGDMQSSHGEGRSTIADHMDSAHIFHASSFEEATKDCEVRCGELVYKIWTDELKSVSERRESFFLGMGLEDVGSSRTLCVREGVTSSCWLPQSLDLDKMTVNSSVDVGSFSPSIDGCNWMLDSFIRDLDSGMKFLIHELGEDGLPCFLKEVGSGRLMTLEEFEKYIGISYSVQNIFQRDDKTSLKRQCDTSSKVKKNSSCWWNVLSMKPARNSRLPKTMRMRVQHNRKKCLEFTAVYMGQEINGHNGPIWTMKFSSDGCYLATAGEDRIVRIWSVDAVDAARNVIVSDGSSRWTAKPEGCKLMVVSDGSYPAPVVLPESIFKLVEKPFQELYGHTNDILDISWSKSNRLLTASKDKTVRLWQFGLDNCHDCLKVFQHNDYVTSVQFDPLDDEYFISGSIDGKVRIWSVRESHVTKWVEVRDIVTVVSYQPNGKGFVVGTLSGVCCFYNSSGSSLQLVKQLFIKGKRKSPGNNITGLQFTPDDPEKVMIISADPKVRIACGIDVIQKYRGLRKSKSQRCASFTEDGKYIVSVSDDSRIYVWNYCKTSHSSSKTLKSVRSCEHFFSEGVSMAVPWPGASHIQRGSCRTIGIDNPKSLPSLMLRDLDRLLGGRFFGDNMSRRTVSPEEKLTTSPESMENMDLVPNRYKHTYLHHADPLESPATLWNQVIVAAETGGALRVFHNFGLPVRV